MPRFCASGLVGLVNDCFGRGVARARGMKLTAATNVVASCDTVIDPCFAA